MVMIFGLHTSLATETEVQDSERDGGVPIITFNNK